MKIVVTGFDPFGGEMMNPAFEAVKLLPESIEGAEVIKVELPTIFGKCEEVLERAIKEHQPDVVLCVGQAGGRSGITVEKVGINFVDARIPDNEQNQPIDECIKADGANAYFTNLPVKAMVKNIKEHGIPASVSYTAGTFVCNDILYRLLYLIEKKYNHIRGGFIHVPYDTKQVLESPQGTPSMPIATISSGLAYAITAIVNCAEDIKAVGGATH